MVVGIAGSRTSVSSDGDAASTLFRGRVNGWARCPTPKMARAFAWSSSGGATKDADAKTARWTVQFFLQGSGDEGERLEADEIHNDPEAGLRLGMVRRAPMNCSWPS